MGSAAQVSFFVMRLPACPATLCSPPPRINEVVRQELERRGHRLDIYPDYTRNAAAVEIIVAEPASGFLRAGADPRQPAYAIVR